MAENSGIEWCHHIDPLARGRASSCKACTSEASTASRYKMTREELRQFRWDNGDVCAICQSFNNLVVDHDHTTGKVRGLLCQNCNSAIGKLRESPALFSAALAYLEKHRG